MIVFALAGVSGLLEVSGGGGEPKPITTVDEESGQRRHLLPQVLPGGDTVLFTIQYEAGSRLALLSLDTGDVYELSDEVEASGARYVSSGHLVYVKNGGLWAMRYDLSTPEVVGSENSIFDGVYSFPDVGAGHFAVSDTGTLVFVSGSAESQLVWVDRGGRTTVMRPESRPYWYPRLSPDGTRVAVVTRSDRGSRDVWVHDLERERFNPFTVEGSDNLFPVWAPDGQRITFGSTRLGSMNLFSKPAVGGVAEPLLVREAAVYPFSSSPDGRFVAFFERHPSNARDIWLLDADGESIPLIVGAGDEKNPVFSPDGRWLTYVSNESGRDEVYVASVADPAERQMVSSDGGAEPTWARNGTELFYRRDHQMFAVPIDTRSRSVPGIRSCCSRVASRSHRVAI